VLGVTAGIYPGPLLTLVISETLKHDTRAGIKVAIAPLITDGPIILISIFILTKISNINSILGLISLLGAIFLSYIAYESLTIKKVSLNLDKKEQSLKKGVITNALSPHPYLFYFSVGGTIMLRALDSNFFALLLFISSFLIFLVGSKIILALIVSKSKTFLQSKFYIYTIRFLGIVLLIFAAIFLKDAFEFFKLL
jgi:threonine/homoserine/homoserine lactone efflux protein